MKDTVHEKAIGLTEENLYEYYIKVSIRLEKLRLGRVDLTVHDQGLVIY